MHKIKVGKVDKGIKRDVQAGDIIEGDNGVYLVASVPEGYCLVNLNGTTHFGYIHYLLCDLEEFMESCTDQNFKRVTTKVTLKVIKGDK